MACSRNSKETSGATGGGGVGGQGRLGRGTGWVKPCTHDKDVELFTWTEVRSLGG